ncbi:hypothetical protein V5799_024102 [Amblyomma americanum]|uniref:Uncharacterized protein n=1 Tax=Amblyomma americanum TaxID=6943 RepID=A0AAQ4EDA4_AMBAM
MMKKSSCERTLPSIFSFCLKIHVLWRIPLLDSSKLSNLSRRHSRASMPYQQQKARRQKKQLLDDVAIANRRPRSARASTSGRTAATWQRAHSARRHGCSVTFDKDGISK